MLKCNVEEECREQTSGKRRLMGKQIKGSWQRVVRIEEATNPFCTEGELEHVHHSLMLQCLLVFYFAASLARNPKPAVDLWAPPAFIHLQAVVCVQHSYFHCVFH